MIQVLLKTLQLTLKLDGDHTLCRSAVYNTVSLDCALSRETRRTQPDAYAAAGGTDVEYLENQCISSGERSSRRRETPHFVLIQRLGYEKKCSLNLRLL